MRIAADLHAVDLISLAENTPMTFRVGAKELWRLQPEPDGNAFPWQISGGALLAAENFTCDRLAGWTNDNRLRASEICVQNMHPTLLLVRNYVWNAGLTYRLNIRTTDDHDHA